MPRLTRRRAFLFAVAAATVLAGVAHYAGASDLLAFALATVALAGMAWVVSDATEQLGRRFGPAATGLLQSTLGNLPEFFVVMFALGDGQVVVAQTSIIGSIFANALLVLGLVIVAGAWRAEGSCMRFRPRLPQDTATLLLVTTFLIVLIGLAVGSHDRASHHVRAISTIGAVALLAVYVAWVIPYVRSGDGQHEPPAGDAPAPLGAALALLAVAGAGSAFVSDWFVSALQPTIEQLHLSQAFAGLVIVAIAGNAVENATGVVLAWKGQSDLAISVVKNSVAQVAAFLFPVLVLVSLFFATPLTFALAPVYIGALGLTAIIVWQITGDGEAAMFEGWALVALFVMLAVFTLYE
ncbi:MAG: Ca2+:H+ antiporter [Solirubrobacteraceae bacterium]|nr:Ca2+:H+ antiporter [Solirubrobacteraceae bacterium]